MKQNILLVTSEFPPLPGGIGNHAFHLAENLSSQGYTIKVVTDQRGSKDQENLFDKDLKYPVKRIAMNKGFRFLTYIQRIISIFTSAKKADVIIASGKFSLWSVSWVSKLIKRRTIAIIHGSEVNFSNPVLSKTTNKALKSFDQVISVSNYTKSLVEHLHLSRITVIPNGFSIRGEINNSKKQHSEVVQLITVGSVTDRKGQENVVRALPSIISTGKKVHYHMVGTPKDKERILRIAEELNIVSNITFHGVVSDKEKNRLLQESDIFVMLSNVTSTGDVEGFGIALIEANYFGIPSVGAKNCGIEDAISSGKSGLLIDAKDSNAMVEAIESIMNNYDDYSYGAKNWSQNFTWEKVIKSYIRVIEE